MKTFIIVSLVSLIACRQPSSCNEGAVRLHVIDSLKELYTIQEGGYTPPKEKSIKQATVTAPKQAKPATTTNTGRKVTFIDGDDVIYKGNRYPIITGPKGGKYFMAPTTEGAEPTRHSLPK